MKESPYFKQVELMLKTIPHVAAETCFALKGGMVIDLFMRDMPRARHLLSVATPDILLRCEAG